MGPRPPCSHATDLELFFEGVFLLINFRGRERERGIDATSADLAESFKHHRAKSRNIISDRRTLEAIVLEEFERLAKKLEERLLHFATINQNSPL